MKTEKVLEIVLREMTAYGAAYRLDWSDFDGRTLRNQLARLADWAEMALRNELDNEYTLGTLLLKEAEDEV